VKSQDERIDAYIARQRDFARPILEHLRETVHLACPEAARAEAADAGLTRARSRSESQGFHSPFMP
jgi:hypothetical protein